MTVTINTPRTLARGRFLQYISTYIIKQHILVIITTDLQTGPIDRICWLGDTRLSLLTRLEHWHVGGFCNEDMYNTF